MRAYLLALLAVSGPAWAVPMEIAHQGRVLDALGDPLTGAVPVQFRLYGVPTGGTALWTEDQTPTFDAGYFTVRLGSVSALDLDDFDGGPLYLALSVNGGAELSRLPLATVPYAFRAARVDGGPVNASEIAVAGQTIIAADGTIDWSHITGTTTLGDLTCDPDDVVTFDGADWTCGPLRISASDLVGLTLDVSMLPVGSGADSVAAGDHTHDTSDLTSGTVAPSRIGFGVGHDDVARGDHTHGAAAIVSGTVDVTRLPVGTTAGTVAAGAHVHAASAITSGTVAFERLPVGEGATEVARGDHTHAAVAHTHDASDLVTGTVGLDRLPVGATASHVARGDHGHATLGTVTFGGPITVGDTQDPCTGTNAGAMRVTGTVKRLEFCDGSKWLVISGGLGTADNPGTDCLDIYTRGGVRTDGKYWIKPDSGAPFEAWCDMTTDGGGWTLVMKQAANSGYGAPLSVAVWSGWSTSGVTMNESDVSTADGNMVSRAYSRLTATTLRMTASTRWTSLATGAWSRPISGTPYSALANTAANNGQSYSTWTPQTSWTDVPFTNHTVTTTIGASPTYALCWRAGPFFNQTSFQYTSGGIKWGWIFNNECTVDGSADTAEGLGCCGNSSWFRASPWTLYVWAR